MTPTPHLRVVTATPEYDAVATIAALSTENAKLVSQIEAMAGTLTAMLSPTPPAVQLAATSTPTATLTVGSEWTVQTLLVAPGEPGRLYVLQRETIPFTRTRLLTSDDFGLTWVAFSDDVPVNAACLRNVNLDYATPDALYASTCQGLYRWSGKDWQLISSKETGMVAVVYGQPETLWVTEPAGLIDTPVLRSDNSGEAWLAASRYLEHANGVATLAIDPQNTNLLYAVIWPEYNGSYLRRGMANGQWETMPTPLNNAPIGLGFTLDGNSGALYVTTNVERGQLWRSPNPTVPDVNTIRWEPVHDFGEEIRVELLASGWSPEGLALYTNLTDVRQEGQPVLHRSLDGGQIWQPLAISF